jgi:phage-related protein
MLNKVYYYLSSTNSNPVKEFIDSLTEIQKAKVFRIFEIFQKYGMTSIIPHVKKLAGTPFWEIRILGKDNIRILYVIPTKECILVLHGFIKKKQKTPITDLSQAMKRYNDWLRRS